MHIDIYIHCTHTYTSLLKVKTLISVATVQYTDKTLQMALRLINEVFYVLADGTLLLWPPTYHAAQCVYISYKMHH